MGNSQSPPANPRFTAAIRTFTQHELEDLKSLFATLSAQSQSKGDFVSLSVFQDYFGLKGPLGERLFDLITHPRKDKKLTFEDLVIAKSVYEKGTRDEIEEFIYKLVDVNGDGIVERSDLELVIVSVLKSIFSVESSKPGSDTQMDIVKVFLNAASFSDVVEGTQEKSMSFEEFRKWCAFLPSLRKFLGSLLIPPNAGRPGSQYPHLVHEDNVASDMILLRSEYAWHIGGALAQRELEEWKFLYHSATNGLSFNTFLGCISKNEGPTVLVVKDNQGYIYGGYASQPWVRHGDFYGDLKCFLFKLYPEASIFKPTGANNNIQWCAVNFSSDTIPNGIGFGGRANHFGMFLSASFDTGQSFECTTFGSPPLSKATRIVPEVIECWGIIQEGPRSEQDAVKGTILERFKEDRHMLNMVGIANASE